MAEKNLVGNISNFWIFVWVRIVFKYEKQNVIDSCYDQKHYER